MQELEPEESACTHLHLWRAVFLLFFLLTIDHKDNPSFHFQQYEIRYFFF